MFKREQPAFGCDALGTGIAANPGGGDHAVAGDDDGNGVGAVGAADAAGGAAGEGRDGGVGSGLAVGDGAQLGPDALAVGRAMWCERQGEGVQFAVEIGVQLVAGTLEHGGGVLVAAPAPVEGDEGACLLRDSDGAERCVEG